MLQPHMGGLKQYFISLFDWLLENDSDNQYVFFYFAHNEEELTKLRSDSWRRNAVLLSDQAQITGRLKNIDLYFCPFGVLWPRPVRVPSVVTLVDIQEVVYPEFFTPIDRFNRAAHFPSSTRAADRVITISEFSKSSIVEHHRIRPSKIIVAHLCAEPSYFDSSDGFVPLPCTNYVFFPANRWYHKNHDVLLRALAVLRDRGEPVNAVFTGFDVPNGYSITEKAQEYGVSKFIHTAGYVTIAQMTYLYRSADMLVFPSLFEGFGMPLVEAMAAGTPALSSASTCLPEICGDAAVYFDPTNPVELANAILRIRKEPGLREALIEKGRVRARQFSQKNMAMAHLQAFREAGATYSRARFYRQRIYQPYHQIRTRVQRKLGRFDDIVKEKNLCRVVFERGWHGVEQDGSDWLRWCSGNGRLKVYSPAIAQLTLDCRIASLQTPNKVRLVVNGALASEWAIEGEFGFVQVETSTVELAKGMNTVDFISTRPAFVGDSDKRPLAFAVKNLRLQDHTGAVSCRLEH